MTSEDATASAEAERPKIAEKVKFWEEQDRINQELIPRVLKQHELLASHIKSHESSSVNMASLEARMLEAIGEARQQTSKNLSEQVSFLEARLIEAIGESKMQSAQETSEQMDSLEARTIGAVTSTRSLALIASGLSFTVAAVAVLLVFVA